MSVDDERAQRRAAPGRSPAAARLPAIELDGVTLHAVTERQAIEHILNELDAGRGGAVVTPNLDHLRRCRTDVHFEALVAEADLVLADGMPLVWASRLQGTPLPERVAGSNLISTLSGAAADRGRSVFLLGGDEGTADGAAKVLQQRFPQLKVAGTFYPPHGFQDNKRVMDELAEALAASKADIVYVALGSPKQERLIATLRSVLPRAWWLGVGVSFSFLCGHVKRAPVWMQRSGIEWVHRLFQEPRRLFKRYLMVGVPFGLSLLSRATMHGVSHRLAGRRVRRDDPAEAGQTDHPVRGTFNGAEARTTAVEPLTGERPLSGVDAALRDLAEPDHTPAELPASPDDTGIAMPLPGIAPERLARLRALILLGGSVRPSPLCTATGRSILDLPLDDGGSLLNYWLSQAVEVTRSAGLERLPVRVLVNQASLEPYSAHEKHFGTFRVERDLSEYRGTGGVLRDVAADYADDDLILVANAAQILLDPLPAIAAALARKGGDVCLVSHDDGTPSGVMLLTCKALRLIPVTGFVDMKEQALPQIAARFDVRVVRRRRPTGLPVRTLEDYVQALRFHHRRRAGKPITTDPLAEDFAPAFSLVEAGATVDASARVHDSVVLAGGVVEPGAALVRCVVSPGATVRRDRTEVDRMVLANARNRGSKKAQPATAAAPR